MSIGIIPGKLTSNGPPIGVDFTDESDNLAHDPGVRHNPLNFTSHLAHRRSRRFIQKRRGGDVCSPFYPLVETPMPFRLFRWLPPPRSLARRRTDDTRNSGTRWTCSLASLFPRVAEEGGPSAGTARLLSLVGFKPSDLPRLRSCVRPFQNKVLPTGFHSLLSFHPQVLVSEPRVSCHIPGLHEVLPSLPFVPHGVWISVCSVLVKIAADGRGATLWGCAIVLGHTTKSLLPCLASTLISRHVSSASRGYCKKRRARCVAARASTTPMGKQYPPAWLNISSFLIDDRLAITCR